MARTHFLGRDKVVYTMDPKAQPALRISPGDTVVLETRDALDNVIARADQLPVDIDFSHVLPATGPIYVEGAEPGDTLEIIFQGIAPAAQGLSVIIPNFGFLAAEFPNPYTKIIPLREGFGDFAPGIRIPLRPFPGVVGVAPAGEPVANIPPGDYGGNLDNKDIVVGTTLVLPVFVPGALLAIGDCHAAQGDGEVCGTAIECDATITMQINLHKAEHILRPRLETPTAYITIAYGKTLEEATKQALLDMIDYLQTEKGLSREDAYILCSLAVDLRITQLVDVLPAVRAVLPKAIFV
ncbi:MAG: acetamidase/formamidase family protein [Chloroflexota bacterium]